MGLFVLGILVGWLAEWLFFTFWVKSDLKDDSSDCEKYKVALEARNKELKELKAGTLTKAPEVNEKESSVTKKTPVKKTETSEEGQKNNSGAVEKNATSTKSTPVKATKVTPNKKSETAKQTAKKTDGDDLTKLSGIGPSMEATLSELGINTYKKLAAMDDDILRDMLEASGARLNNNKVAMDSWNEQAELADKGDFEGLKKLQAQLKR